MQRAAVGRAETRPARAAFLSEGTLKTLTLSPALPHFLPPSLPFLISSSLLSRSFSLCTRFHGVQYGYGWRTGFHTIFMVSPCIHGFSFIFMVSVYFHGFTLNSWFHAVFTTSRNTRAGRRCREKIQRPRAVPKSGGRRRAPGCADFFCLRERWSMNIMNIIVL